MIFYTLDGKTRAFGEKDATTLDDEKAHILSLGKQSRAVDPNKKEDVATLQKNLNTIHLMLGIDVLPEDGFLDEPTQMAWDYFKNNEDVFRQHGISQHVKAKELEKMTAPAEMVFTDAEYAPTMDEMKKLEVDFDDINSTLS